MAEPSQYHLVHSMCLHKDGHFLLKLVWNGKKIKLMFFSRSRLPVSNKCAITKLYGGEIEQVSAYKYSGIY